MMRAQVGQWMACWRGGRLMDVSHVEFPDHVSDSIEVLPHDMPNRPDFWQESRGPFGGAPGWDDAVTPELQRQSLEEWIREYGDDHRGQLQYQ